MDGSPDMLTLRPLQKRLSNRVSDGEWTEMHAEENDPAIKAFFGGDGFVPTPDLPERNMAQLDKMVREFGLRAVLSGLTHYCYDRARGGDEETFQQFEDSHLWERAAKIVETATINDRVRLLK